MDHTFVTYFLHFSLLQLFYLYSNGMLRTTVVPILLLLYACTHSHFICILRTPHIMGTTTSTDIPHPLVFLIFVLLLLLFTFN